MIQKEPKAGYDLLNKIYNLTEAKKDQDHRSLVLVSLPQKIVDRSAFLDGHEPINPAKSIAKIIKSLDQFEVDVVGIACNTVYVPKIFDFILSELRYLECNTKIIHMPMETCNYIKINFPECRRVGVMSTNGTYKSRMYEELLLKLNFEVIVPDTKFQNEVIHNMIYNSEYGIKSVTTISNELVKQMETALQYFSDQKADVVILACTELSYFFTERQVETKVLIVDSNEILALALLKESSR